MKNFKYFLFVFALASIVCVFASSNALAQGGGTGHGGDDPLCCFNAPSETPSLKLSEGLIDVIFPMTMPEMRSSFSETQFSFSANAVIRYETAIVEQKQRVMGWL